MEGQWWGGGPVGQHWPGSRWRLPAQRHSAIAYGTILQLIFICALARAQWSFYNWGFSKKLYYPNQLASSPPSSSSSSSSSFLKAVITSRSVFSLLWSFSFLWGLWAQLQVVALQGALEGVTFHQSRVRKMLQGLSCRGRSWTDALLWVTQHKIGQRLLYPVQCRGGKIPLEVIPGAVLRDPFLAIPALCLTPKACFICLPLLTFVAWPDQCCMGRKESDVGCSIPLFPLLSSHLGPLWDFSLAFCRVEPVPPG